MLSYRKHLAVAAVAGLGLAGCGASVVGALSSAPAHPPRVPIQKPTTRRDRGRQRSRDSIIDGYVQLCGGTAPGLCHIGGAIGECVPGEGCVTDDRVAVTDANGRRIAQQKLHHARFHLHLRPGAYTVELLGDSKQVHRRVLQRQQLTATGQQTTIIRFLFLVP